MRDLIKDLINPSFLEFVRNNLDTNIERLLLSSSKGLDFDIKKVATQIQSLKKARKKLPSWFENKDVLYPPKVSMEQCSSELTAGLKASLFSGGKLLDMTAGAGVDTYFFSKRFENVTAIEKNQLLSEITSYNLEKLKADNINVLNADSIEFLKDSDELYDLIYIDPSRRDTQNQRIFKLEDCDPNVIAHRELLIMRGKKVLIKVSPLLDITSIVNELGSVSEVYVISLKNEVKEVLYLLENKNRTIQVKTHNISDAGIEKFDFDYKEHVHVSLADQIQEYVYEPNSSIMKSMGMDFIAAKFRLMKLSVNTHLYTSGKLERDFPGRIFRVEDVLIGSSKTIKKLISNQRANIISRNYPLSADQLSVKYRIKSQDEESYIIFTKLHNENIIIKSSKLTNKY